MSITYRPLMGWPWAETSDRKYDRFKVTYDQTKRQLRHEIEYQSGGGDDIIIELDIDSRDVRRDGTLRANTKPRSPKVVVTFQDVHHGWVRYHSDQYTTWRANVRGISLILGALRGIDRWGGQTGEQYHGFVSSRALDGHVMTTDEAIEYLKLHVGENLNGTDPNRNADDARKIVRLALKGAHPDGGGSDNELRAVQQCREVLTNHHGVEI